MNKKFVATVVCLCAFACGLSANIAAADSSYKTAVVDVNQIIQNSAKVQALKTKQEKQSAELKSLLEKAKASIDKEKDATKKAALEKKYKDDFNTKYEAFAKEAQTDMAAIEKSITSDIAKYAQTNNYNVVLPKNFVIYGGDDITGAIQAIVK